MNEADALAKVQDFAANLSLPQLSAVELQRSAYEHHDAISKGARAQDICNVLEGAARHEWIQRRELEFLRAGIAMGNPELVRLMRETREPAVKSAIIDAIYGAAANAYPALAPVALAVAAQKKAELGISEPSSSIPGEIELEIEEPPQESLEEPPEPGPHHQASAAVKRAPEPAGARERPTTEDFGELSRAALEPREEPSTSVEDELRRIANLQFLAICQINELASLCEKRGITLSPELQIALLENMLVEAYRCGLHKRIPLAIEIG